MKRRTGRVLFKEKYERLKMENKVLKTLVSDKAGKKGANSHKGNDDIVDYLICNSEFIFMAEFYKQFFISLATLINQDNKTGFFSFFSLKAKPEAKSEAGSASEILAQVHSLHKSKKEKARLLGEIIKGSGQLSAEESALLAFAAWYYDPAPFRLKFLVFKLIKARLKNLALIFLKMLPKDISFSESEKNEKEKLRRWAKRTDQQENNLSEISIFFNARANAEKLVEALKANEELKIENMELNKKLKAFAFLAKHFHE